MTRRLLPLKSLTEASERRFVKHRLCSVKGDRALRSFALVSARDVGLA